MHLCCGKINVNNRKIKKVRQIVEAKISEHEQKPSKVLYKQKVGIQATIIKLNGYPQISLM